MTLGRLADTGQPPMTLQEFDIWTLRPNGSMQLYMPQSELLKKGVREYIGHYHRVMLGAWTMAHSLGFRV